MAEEVQSIRWHDHLSGHSTAVWKEKRNHLENPAVSQMCSCSKNPAPDQDNGFLSIGSKSR